MTNSEKLWAALGFAGGIAGAYLLGRSSGSQKYINERWRKFMGIDATTEELVDSYVEHIRIEAPNNLRSFEDLRRDNPEGALAEAAVFGVLDQLRLHPVISDVFAGGADFLCEYRPIWFSPNGATPLAVEVTTFEPSALERNSEWPEEAGPFRLVTGRIKSHAGGKLSQLSKHEMPRVLVIASSHIGADALLTNTLAAQAVLISQAQISQPIDGGEAYQVTDLHDSVFLRGDPQTRQI